MSLIYFFCAAILFGCLIFFHELGHYIVARAVGMKVCMFSIGFGPAIIKWSRNGVEWRLCLLPFGGYVKIEGSDLSDDSPETEDGFFNQPPWKKIAVALAGPVANFLLTMVLLTFISYHGGLKKSFSEITTTVGWVNKNTDVYSKQLRPGDVITTVDDEQYTGRHKIFLKDIGNKDSINISGIHLNQDPNNSIPFSINASSLFGSQEHKFSDCWSSGEFLIYDKVWIKENALPEGSPMGHSGIEYGDRLVWMDGCLLFSSRQMLEIIRENKALLTVIRNSEPIFVRAPRYALNDFEKNDFIQDVNDYAHESLLTKELDNKILWIPYIINNDCIIESELPYKSSTNDAIETALLPGDKIIAVDGNPIQNFNQLLTSIQKHKFNIIVQKDSNLKKPMISENAEKLFLNPFKNRALYKLINTVGISKCLDNNHEFALLNPVEAKKIFEFDLTATSRSKLEKEFLIKESKIQKIKNKQKRELYLKMLQDTKENPMLGIHLQDQTVVFNPGIPVLIKNVFEETIVSLKALFSFKVSPKMLTGPIGIIKVLQNSCSLSLNDALFWCSLISVNLGIVNLLPMPIMDGGHIAFALWEQITGKRISKKILSKLILPFFIALIVMLAILTFNDILSLF